MSGGGLQGAMSGFGKGVSSYAKPVTNFLGGIGKNLGFGAAGSGNTGINIAGALKSAGTGAGGSGGGFNIGGLFDLGTKLMSIGQQTGGLEQQIFSMPEYQRPPEVEQYAAMIGKAKTELGQMSMDEIKAKLAAPIGSMIPNDEWMNAIAPLKTRVAQKVADAIQANHQNFNAMGRPNSSEMLQEDARIQAEGDQAINDYEAALMGEKLKMELDYRVTALSAALGLEQSAAAELAGLTNLSVQEAALQFGIEAQQVAEIRKMAGLQDLMAQMGYNGGGGGSIGGDINAIIGSFREGTGGTAAAGAGTGVGAGKLTTGYYNQPGGGYMHVYNP
jgi:hypothetical protein